MTVITYSRRKAPTPTVARWLDVEHDNIQRAMQGVQDAVDAIPAPPVVASAQRTSSVTNNTNTLSTAGLDLAVSSGESWAIRYVLRLTSVAAGTVLAVSVPTATVAFFGGVAPSTSVTALKAYDTATPATGFTVATFAATMTVRFDIILRALTASGMVDLQFANGGGGGSVTIGDGSYALATKL